MTRSNAGNTSFHKKRLHDIISYARPRDFLIMVWAAHALMNGNREAAEKRLNHNLAPEDYAFAAKAWVPPWELEQLINEYFAMPSFRFSDRKRLDCSKWGSFAKCVNRLKAFNNSESVKDHPENLILQAMPRILFPQYNWQKGWVNAKRLVRYHNIYGNPKCSDFLFKATGLSASDILKYGMASYAICRGDPAARVETDFSLIDGRKEEFRNFVNHFGLSFKAFREHTLDVRRGNVISEFKRSPLAEFPIIIGNENDEPIAFIPLPDLIVRRVTEGLYYDLVGEPALRNEIGKEFEKHCFTQLEHQLPTNQTLLGEFEYTRGMSPDILILDTDSKSISIIMECKSRRLPRRVLASPNPYRDAPEVYQDIIKGIIQIWRFASDVDSNLLNDGEMSISEETVGILQTLDPWLVMDPSTTANVTNEACKVAEEKGIDPKFWIPIAVVNVDDWEEIIENTDFSDIVRLVREMSSEKFYGYLMTSIKSELKKEGVIFSENTKEKYPWMEKLKEIFEWLPENIPASLDAV